jgi:hypothetical protein
MSDTIQITNADKICPHAINRNENHVGFPTTATLLYRLAKRPNFLGVGMDALVQQLQFPKFIQHLREHPYFTTLSIHIDARTTLNVWNTLRVTVPASTYYPTETTLRLDAYSGLSGRKSRWSPIFYVPTSSVGVRVRELETLHGTPNNNSMIKLP